MLVIERKRQRRWTSSLRVLVVDLVGHNSFAKACPGRKANELCPVPVQRKEDERVAAFCPNRMVDFLLIAFKLPAWGFWTCNHLALKLPLVRGQ